MAIMFEVDRMFTQNIRIILRPYGKTTYMLFRGTPAADTFKRMTTC